MAQITTNYDFPYPELSDSKDVIVQTVANATIQIDEVIKSVSAVNGASIGEGLELSPTGELQVKPGFGISLNPSTGAVDVNAFALTISPDIQKLQNDFQIVTESDISVVQNGANIDIAFTSKMPYEWISETIADSGSALVTQSVVFGLGKVANQKSIVCFSYDSINNAVPLYPTFALDYDASSANYIKALYVDTDVYLIAIAKQSGANSFADVYRVNINTQVIDFIISQQIPASDRKLFDIAKCATTHDVALVYCNGVSLTDIKATIINVDTPLAGAPFNLYSVLPTNPIKSITVSADSVTNFVSFFNEGGTQLHSISFTAFATVVDATTIEAIPIEKPLFSTGLSTGCSVGYVNSLTGQLVFRFKKSTVIDGVTFLDASYIGDSRELVGMTNNGTQVIAIIKHLTSATNRLFYVYYVSSLGGAPVVIGSLTEITLSTKDVTNPDNEFLLGEITGLVSNLIFSTLTSATPRMAFVFSSLLYADNKNYLYRIHTVVGSGSESFSSIAPQQNPFLLVNNTRNARSKIRINFPNAHILSLAAGQVAFIELLDTELTTLTDQVFTRDGTLNGPGSELTGLKIEPISSYAHTINRVIIFFRNDSITGTEIRKLFFGNGTQVNVPGVYLDTQDFSGTGLVTSGTASRVRLAEPLHFNEEGKISIEIDEIVTQGTPSSGAIVSAPIAGTSFAFVPLTISFNGTEFTPSRRLGTFLLEVNTMPNGFYLFNILKSTGFAYQPQSWFFSSFLSSPYKNISGGPSTLSITISDFINVGAKIVTLSPAFYNSTGAPATVTATFKFLGAS